MNEPQPPCYLTAMRDADEFVQRYLESLQPASHTPANPLKTPSSAPAKTSDG